MTPAGRTFCEEIDNYVVDTMKLEFIVTRKLPDELDIQPMVPDDEP